MLSARSQVRWFGASDRPFVIERQSCSPSTKSQVSNALHIRSQSVATVQPTANTCCMPLWRPEIKSEICLGYLGTELMTPPAKAAECVTTRPPRTLWM